MRPFANLSCLFVLTAFDLFCTAYLLLTQTTARAYCEPGGADCSERRGQLCLSKAVSMAKAMPTTKPHGTGMGLRINRTGVEYDGCRCGSTNNSPGGERL